MCAFTTSVARTYGTSERWALGRRCGGRASLRSSSIGETRPDGSGFDPSGLLWKGKRLRVCPAGGVLAVGRLETDDPIQAKVTFVLAQLAVGDQNPPFPALLQPQGAHGAHGDLALGVHLADHDGDFEVLTDSVRGQYQGWYADYFDIREDRVVIYGSFGSRVTELQYRVKATAAGTARASASRPYNRAIAK